MPIRVRSILSPWTTRPDNRQSLRFAWSNENPPTGAPTCGGPGQHSCEVRPGRGAKPRAAESRLSERPDLDLAESHDAAAVLKCDPPLRELRILGAVDCLDAVEDHGEFAPLGGDVVVVPLVAGLRHRRDLGDIDDRA